MAVSDLTQLEAINIIIGTIGLSPVQTLVSPGTDVATAASILDECTRNTLLEGWEWNTEDDYPLSPDASNEIVWPANIATLRKSRDEVDERPRYVRRNGKVYDKVDRTYTFTATLEAYLVLYLEWDDIPQAARYYATICAARKFANRFVGSREIDGFTERDELYARSSLLDEESRAAEYSIWDDFSTARPLYRNQGSIRYYNR